MAQTPEIVHCAAPSSSILGADEPTPFEVYNKASAATVLLIFDHAGRFIPRGSADWVSARQSYRHIAWDIGIADVTKCLATLFDGPAVLRQFSRSIIDPNRPMTTNC
jgi:predicted N-formylglutamate amidohydrolase